VSGINGTVQIEATDGATAEVYVLRTARNDEALQRKKFTIEQNGTSLVIRGGKDGWHFWRWLWNGKISEQVVLKVPRQIELDVHGVNGRVTVGEIEGSIDVSGVNGKVELAQANGYSNVSGVNGRVQITIKQLGERGLSLSGINGGIELQLGNDLNADLNATGINGQVNSEISSVTVSKDHSTYRARIGQGGSPITLSGINGGVRLTSLTSSAS
jgi:DUF4097 and DUF4098 domain-containing protein YvlB